jgi:hypothetical protein
VLNPIPDQTALVGQLFTYQVIATDPDGHSLRYSVSNPPSNSVMNFTTGEFTWTPSLTGTQAVTVVVSDTGPLELKASRSFNIIVTTGIRIGSIERVSPNQLSISLSATAGKTYRAEYKNDLSDPIWTPIEPGTVAQGSTVSISITIGAELNRFFRVVQVD